MHVVRLPLPYTVGQGEVNNVNVAEMRRELVAWITEAASPKTVMILYVFYRRATMEGDS